MRDLLNDSSRGSSSRLRAGTHEMPRRLSRCEFHLLNPMRGHAATLADDGGTEGEDGVLAQLTVTL